MFRVHNLLGVALGAAVICAGGYFLSSAQSVHSVTPIAPLVSLAVAEQNSILNRFASGDVIYGPAAHKDPTTTLRNIVINHPYEPGTFGAVTVYNASATNGVTIRQGFYNIAHHIDPGQTLCFPMRLQDGMQIGVEFDAPGADNKILWVIRNYQIRPTDA